MSPASLFRAPARPRASYHFWLGHESDELDEYMKAMVWERHEIERHQHECKPEADGFITVIPEVK